MPAFGRTVAVRRNITDMKILARRFNRGPSDHWVRVVWMYDLSRWVTKHGLGSPRVLLKLSDDDPELGLFAPNRTVSWTHGDNTEMKNGIFSYTTAVGDLHYPLPKEISGVDVVLLCGTLEHLYDPLRALVNLRNALEEGGHISISVPTNIAAHMTPFHFQQFTLMGLGVLVLRAGLEVVEAGQWGSKEYEIMMFSGLRELIRFRAGKLEGVWPGYGRLRNLVGDAGHVDHVWVLARK